MQTVHFLLQHLLSLCTVRVFLQHAHHDSLQKFILSLHLAAIFGACSLVGFILGEFLGVFGYFLLQAADFVLECRIFFLRNSERFLHFRHLLLECHDFLVLPRSIGFETEDLFLSLAEFFQKSRVVSDELVGLFVEFFQARDLDPCFVAILCERYDLPLQLGFTFLELLRLRRLALLKLLRLISLALLEFFDQRGLRFLLRIQLRL